MHTHTHTQTHIDRTNPYAQVKTPMKGGTLVISGDGRYFNKDAVQIIAKVRNASRKERWGTRARDRRAER